MSTSLLDVRDLAVRFRQAGRDVPAVNGVSFTAEPGRTLAIVGESGSGKTVSCRAVMGLLPPSAVVTGSARFAGTELLGLSEDDLRRHRGADLAMVFQDPARSLNPTMRVGTQVSEAIRSHLPLDRSAARERAIELMATRRLFSAVRMPYTKALLDAIPRLKRPPHSPLPVIGGRPPDTGALPPGCPFAPRCPPAADRCRQQAPPLAEHEPGHRWACWFPCENGDPR